MKFWESEPADPIAADADKVDIDGTGDQEEPQLPGKNGKKGKGSKKGQNTASEEQELKLAKLWARVDELEEESFRQKEKLRVLEKGMTLGLIPEELKKGKKPPPPDAAPPPPPVKEEPVAAENPPATDPNMPAGLTKPEMEKYQTMMATAHDQFRAGRYGRAIVEYDALGKAFGDRVEGGMHRYWIAKSWENLKEHNTARQILLDFVKDFPTSPWAPRAKLELARVEWRLGLQDTALKRFRDVIQEHPYEDAAEMAKMELEHLDKSL